MNIKPYCDLCNAALLSDGPVSKENLTTNEAELLKCGSKTGRLTIRYDALFGIHITTKDYRFAISSEPYHTAIYLDAFISLCRRGLLLPTATDEFQLTREAYDLARQLPSSADKD